MGDLHLQQAQNALDFAGLQRLKSEARAHDPAALRQAARQFEAIFIQQMLKSMRATLPGDPLTDSQQGKIYQGMLDQQLAENLAQGKGIGLADMLVRQLSRKFTGPGNAAAPTAAAPHAAPRAPRTAAPRNGTLARAEHFIGSILPAARQAAAALGVSPVAILAHAALETGWGRHIPEGGNGRSSFNLFGIKAAGWDGARVRGVTGEFRHGAQHLEQAAFRAYGGVAEGIRDYTHLLLHDSRFEGLRGFGDNIAAFARGLQAAGYATDPRYAEKLLSVAQGKTMRRILQQLHVHS